MTLVDEYRRQISFRSWAALLDRLGELSGRRVLDLGCGPGDVAALLVARGAEVVGIDGNEELLDAARARVPERATFVCADLEDPGKLKLEADGIWSSFAAAYFPDLAPVLRRWKKWMKPGAWIALTEIDDLFGHEPIADRTRELLEGFVADALGARRYDFRMGRKLAEHLRACGFEVIEDSTVPDRELSFAGPAADDVLDAWRRRFDRMKLLQAFCGEEHAAVTSDFLACLARPEHRSLATVRFCLARIPA